MVANKSSYPPGLFAPRQNSLPRLQFYPPMKCIFFGVISMSEIFGRVFVGYLLTAIGVSGLLYLAVLPWIGR